MADFQPAASGKGRRKLSTPRIDLTPMVDLGFLLITFFMYTTTLAKPKVMELQMPLKTEGIINCVAIPAEATLVIIPTIRHQVAYYPGTSTSPDELRWCRFEGPNNLRMLLQQETVRVKALPPSFSREAHKLHVLIKPDTSAAYEDVVHALDEMAISEVPYYTLMKPTVDEVAAMKKFPADVYGK